MIKNSKLVSMFLNGQIHGLLSNENMKVVEASSKLMSYNILIAQFAIDKDGLYLIINMSKYINKFVNIHRDLLISMIPDNFKYRIIYVEDVPHKSKDLRYFIKQNKLKS